LHNTDAKMFLLQPLLPVDFLLLLFFFFFLAPQCSTTLDLINPCSTFSFFQSPTKHHSTRREVDAPADAPADARDQPKAASAPSFSFGAKAPSAQSAAASTSRIAELVKLGETTPGFSLGTGNTPKKPKGRTPIKLKKQRTPLKQGFRPKSPAATSPATRMSPTAEGRSKLIRRKRSSAGLGSTTPVNTPTK